MSNDENLYEFNSGKKTSTMGNIIDSNSKSTNNDSTEI